MTAYTYGATLTWGGDIQTGEMEVEVSYTVAWGTPETGRGYMADPYKYDPGSPDVVEGLKLLTVDGEPAETARLFGGPTRADDEQTIFDKLLDGHEDAMIDVARREEAF